MLLGASPRGRCAGSSRLQIEADRGGIAELGTDVVHGVLLLAVDLDRDSICSDGQTGVEVVALLVAFDFIVAFDVFALNFDQSAFERRAVFALHISFD